MRVLLRRERSRVSDASRLASNDEEEKGCYSQSTKLLESLQSRTDDQSPPVPSLRDHASQPLSEARPLHHSSTLRHTPLEHVQLPPDFLLTRLGVDLLENDESLGVSVLLEEDSRGFGEPDEEKEIDEGWDGSESNHVPPSSRDVGEGGSDTVGYDLTESNGDDVAVEVGKRGGRR